MYGNVFLNPPSQVGMNMQLAGGLMLCISTLLDKDLP